MKDVKLQEVYSWEERITAPSTAEISVSGSSVKDKQVVRIDTFIVCDETTVNRLLGIGYMKGDTKRWLKLERAGASGYSIILLTPLFLFGGEKPCVNSTTHATSDVINIIARGVYL